MDFEELLASVDAATALGVPREQAILYFYITSKGCDEGLTYAKMGKLLSVSSTRANEIIQNVLVKIMENNEKNLYLNSTSFIISSLYFFASIDYLMCLIPHFS